MPVGRLREKILNFFLVAVAIRNLYRFFISFNVFQYLPFLNSYGKVNIYFCKKLAGFRENSQPKNPKKIEEIMNIKNKEAELAVTEMYQF